MAIIQISYDLNQPGREYGPLIARIKELGTQGWCKPLESVWIIKADLGVTLVRDDLMNYIDQSSRVLVLDVTADPAAWYGLPKDVSDWLLANL